MAYLAITTSLEAGILWSAPAERSGDGAFSWAYASQPPKRRRRFALPAHSIRCQPPGWWYWRDTPLPPLRRISHSGLRDALARLADGRD